MAVISRRLSWTKTVLFVMFCCALVLADPRVDLDPSSHPSFILPGLEFELICSIYQLPGNAFEEGVVVTFRKDDQTFVGSYTPTNQSTASNHISIKGANHTASYKITLTFNGITQEDGGHYQCGLLQSDEWTIGSRSLELLLIKFAPPEYPVCSYKRKSGGKVTLSCEAKNVVPPPTIKLYQGNVLQSDEIKNFYGTYKVEVEKDLEDIADMNVSFVCKYSYPGRTFDNRTCWIGKPKLFVTPTGGSQPYTIGDDVTVTFTAAGHPQITKPMTCSWNYLQRADDLQATYEGNENAVITLSDVQISMSGTIVNCTASNAMGSTSASFTLYVEDFVENNLTASLTTEKVYLSVGQSTTFNCEIGFIPPVQQVNYDWFFQDMPVKVNIAFWKNRFNKTQYNNQLVLNSVSPDDDGQVISCRAHYRGRTLMSSKTEIVVCSNPNCQPVQQQSCQYQIPTNEGVIWIVGALACAVVVIVVAYCAISRLRRRPRQANSDFMADGTRTSSFASSASESQSENSSQLSHLRHDRSPALKRSASLPSSRGLPSIPVPTTLPPVHEYERAPRSDTYSIIKCDTEPKETSHQAYMDMAAGKMTTKELAGPCFEKIPPLMVSMEAPKDGQNPHSDTSCSGGAAASSEEWYLEARRSPLSTVRYHDLEDLYRETAKNNVYSPRDK